MTKAKLFVKVVSPASARPDGTFMKLQLEGDDAGTASMGSCTRTVLMLTCS